MVTHNWKLDNNRSISYLLYYESDINIVIIYQNDMQRANISRTLVDKVVDMIQERSLWGIKLRNGNMVKFVPSQRAQIETRGINISLLLFPDSIEYNVRREITRELRPDMIRNGGITGTIRI